MQRELQFEPESLRRSSLHCGFIYTSKSRTNIDFTTFSQHLFSLRKQAIFQSTRFHGWSIINYIKAIFLTRVYIMSMACNFHLFACCMLPPPAIICYYGPHIGKTHLCECLCAQLSPVASRINIIILAGHNIQKGIIQAQLEFILQKNLIGRNDMGLKICFVPSYSKSVKS